MNRKKERIIEEQVAAWQARELPSPRRVGARKVVIAIDALAGARGPEVARLVADMLNLPLYEHEIVSTMAELGHVHESAVEALDEIGQSHVEDLILGMLNEHSFDRDDYLVALGHAVTSLTANGPCVLLGHGAVHVVDRAQALTAQITSPDAARIRLISRRDRVSAEDAEHRLHESDRNHDRFHQHYFRLPTVGDTYDLVIDSSHLGTFASAALVVSAYANKVGDTRQGVAGRIAG